MDPCAIAQALVWLIKPDVQLLPEAVDRLRSRLAHQPNIAILGTPILNIPLISFGLVLAWYKSGRFWVTLT
jgi:hypothetical protein